MQVLYHMQVFGSNLHNSHDLCAEDMGHGRKPSIVQYNGHVNFESLVQSHFTIVTADCPAHVDKVRLSLCTHCTNTNVQNWGHS